MFRKKQGSEVEDAKIKELRDSLGTLSGKDLSFCTDACLKRYLVARSWNVKKAKKKLEDTLQWRASYKPDEIDTNEVPSESETAKVSIANFRDRLGRSVLITRTGYAASPRYFFYNVEKAVLNHPEGQEQIVWLSDSTGFSYDSSLHKNEKDMSVIVENHYPGTFGLFILYNPSRFADVTLKALKFFMDSISSHKIKTVLPENKKSVELMSSIFDMDILTMMSSGVISGDCFEPRQPLSSGEISGASFGPRQPLLPQSSSTTSLGFNLRTFTIAELEAATGRFAQSNLLGQGGFGYVHKGVLTNGKEVAVKSLKVGSGQGESEFQAEVEIISRLHHRHLVLLVGYCIEGDQRMLVYEFAPNKTLEYHLHGSGTPVMDWPFRLRIALGSAKGLAYLHEDCHSCIIHRDIKAANILIDNNFEAMVADFGLAKLTADNETHVSTRIMGTFGYLAPEYAASGQLTERSDVFSFGVMLLELITGKRPVNIIRGEDSLVDWARPLLTLALEDGKYDELVDPRLGNNYDRQEMKRLIACASASVSHSSRKRPRMSQIARALEGDVSIEALNVVPKPTVNSLNNTTSSGFDTQQYNKDIAYFKQTAFGSEDSGDYSGST